VRDQPGNPDVAASPGNSVATVRSSVRQCRVRNFDPKTSFGADAASRYDDTLRGDEPETVACLNELARGGPVLELAIGTGRIGLPLAATGLRVDGIEQSDAMVARLRAKPGGAEIAVTMGDMADVSVLGKLSAYLPRLQHAVKPADPRRSGPLLRERGQPPH